MKPFRLQNTLGQLVLLSAALMLGACNSPALNSSSPVDTSGGDPVMQTQAVQDQNVTIGNDLVTTVDVSGGDTQEAVLASYGGGSIVAWHPEAGFAILQQDNLQSAKAVGSKVKSKKANKKTHQITEAAGTGAWSGGFGAWSGGFGAWSGGFGAWSGGYGAWSGGTSTSVSSTNPNAAVFNQIRLAQAATYAVNAGLGIKVAVIDTGIDLAHPSFAGHLVAASEMYDWVDGDASPQEGFVTGGLNLAFGHGTVAASIIGQVAPNVKIMPLRVLNADGFGDTSNVVKAIDWAVLKGAKVINLSLGSVLDDTAVDAEIKYAYSKGVIVVASSGNTYSTILTYPAANAKVANALGYGLIGVGSVGTINLDVKSGFTAYGTNLEMVAPGEGIFSAFPNNQTARATGTSFATPMVTAGVALALGQGTAMKLTSKDLAAAMTAYTDSVNAVNPSYSGLLGSGRLNLEKFVKKALGLIP
jgi:thermitase